MNTIATPQQAAQQLAAPVIVSGAGPVGITLAMNLASLGVKVIVLEVRHFAEPPNVKCNHVAARTMEVFRRLGVARKVRGAGLPADYPHDVAFRTSAMGLELSRVPIPCRRDRYTETEGPDTMWPTPEPPHRINQKFLEPILLRHLAEMPGVTLLNRTQLLGFTQQVDADGAVQAVEATVRDLDRGSTSTLRGRFLVGCDGGGSLVRKGIGAKMEGDPVIQRVQSTYIRAPHMPSLLPGKRAWAYYSMNPRRCGTMFSIDGHETWLVHNHLKAGEEYDTVDRDRALRNIIGAPPEFSYEIINTEDWVGRRLLASRFRDRNVFIAGDAAHLWVPSAGYGMNAGIADAVNLSWLLAACIDGWGDPAMLDAYEAERYPITEQVSRFAMEHTRKLMQSRRAIPADIEAPGEEGDRVRAEVGAEAYALNVAQFCCAGLNFGYFYNDSPILVPDGEEAPPYGMRDYVASTVPGCRAPHFWLPDGRSVYDAFGPGYTLLRFDPACDVAPFERAAHMQGMPLKTLDVATNDVPPEYRHKLVLCRADQHVAWRGDLLPAQPERLVERLRGAGKSLALPRKRCSDEALAEPVEAPS